MTRRIVVTGATRGLGRAMIDGFIQAGHIVCGCGRSLSKVDELRRVHGHNHSFAVVDVADDESVGQWVDQLLCSGPVPDLVINNAALMNSPAPLWEVPPEEFSGLLAVNLQGVYSVIRHLLPAMIRREQGVIVNFSSGWGRSTAPQVAPYCTTKFGIEGLTQALAQEIPAPLAAIALNPGVINTEMLRLAWSEAASSFPLPVEWADRAVPRILRFSRRDNGRSLTI